MNWAMAKALTRGGLRIVVSGMIAADPYQGGAAWAVLQYVLGLSRLGHRVWLVEPIPRASLRPLDCAPGETRNASYFREVAAAFDLESATWLVAGTQETVGLPYRDLVRVAQGADVLINISGMLADPELIQAIPRRVYLDLDPAFNQLWHAVQGIDMRFDGHTHFATVGQRLGQPDCLVPTCGRSWSITVPPVVLERWPMVSIAPERGMSTVGNWRAYGSIEHDGVLYGQKCHALRPLIGIPASVGESFDLALTIHPGETRDIDALTRGGWSLVDPSTAAGTPARYEAFIRASKGEFSVAKSGYVASRCGWFSDRSACYLASGRPVIAQDTGFSTVLPTGEGLFAFETADDVKGALEAVNGDYARHARAARALAEAHFDSDRVLTRLLQLVDAAA